ncbi:MAG: hypothetical protein ACOVLI_12165, partial [Rhabdaerophilum sp.]
SAWTCTRTGFAPFSAASNYSFGSSAKPGGSAAMAVKKPAEGARPPKAIIARRESVMGLPGLGGCFPQAELPIFCLPFYDDWILASSLLRSPAALACASRLRQDECRAGATPNLQKAFVPMVFDDTRNLGHSGGSDRCRGTAAWPELPSARSGPRGQGMME